MKMHVMARENGLLTSSLNPNAPMFVPAAYRNVEDFSDQWWSLVQSSPSFRDYWLRECFSESLFEVSDDYDFDSFIPDDLIGADGKVRGIEEKKAQKDLILARLSNWHKARSVELPRLYEKAPKIVNVKVSPRPIHQPR
ncbi:protein EARLY RESPONSIVE TO DEHYDRATION 15-like isoform X2 [Bidens hawaiensis]|uniref:protein EARLY RESPONSIVE TO DEHYDRATION 15-like isoform X2 n=1 Tax=Bidens hawaiensis TaxID=980011 RepID=UPI00404B3441